MILTNDKFTKPAKKKDKPVLIEPPGTRTQAANFFNDQAFSNNTRTALMNATVRLKTAAGNIGSGVILFADAKAKIAYVLSAKHCLYTLSNLKTPGEKIPSDFKNNTFYASVEIGYQPAQLLGEPASKAPLTGISFPKGQDKDWSYDVVLFQSTDEAFLAFVTNNDFITPLKDDYPALLSLKKTGAEALNAKDYHLFQLGYGAGRDSVGFPDTKDAEVYTDYANKLQIKISSPQDGSLVGDAFEIEGTDSSKWPTSTNVCLLKAGITNSSGPGDSGGPLFCCKKTDRSKVYLVGVTSGANFYSDAKYKEPNPKLPDEKKINSNAATYWKPVFDVLQANYAPWKKS